MQIRFTTPLVFAMFCSSILTFAEAKQPKPGPEYSKWLNEDVRWIMTNQERRDFLTLIRSEVEEVVD